jgi:WD40 repeat protein
LADEALYAVAVTPDGKRLAAAGTDGKIHFWNVPTNHVPTAP